MSNNRCADCGQTFADTETLEVHYKVSDCQKNPSGSSKSHQAPSNSPNDRSPLGSKSKVEGVEGKVVHYDREGAYGFIRTVELPSQGETVRPEEVFFHINDIGATGVYEGYWLKGDVVEGEQGPKLVDGEVISRKSQEIDKSESSERGAKNLGFGGGDSEEIFNPGRKPENTSDRDIEDHRDDRKFR